MELSTKILSKKQMRAALPELNSVNIMRNALATHTLVELLIKKGVFTQDEFNQVQAAVDKSEDGRLIEQSEKAIIAMALLEED